MVDFITGAGVMLLGMIFGAAIVWGSKDKKE